MDTNPQGGSADPVQRIASLLANENAFSEPEPPQEAAPEEVTEVPESAPEQSAEAPEESAPVEDGQAEETEDEVEYEGNKYRVPKELKDALLRHADYTRKTQEVAEQRRVVEARQEAIKEQEAQLKLQNEFQQVALDDMAQVRALETSLKKFENVDWQAFSDNDPVAAQKAWFQFQQMTSEHGRIAQGLQRKYQEFRAKSESVQAEALQRGIEVLKKDIPNWSPDYAKEIREAGKANYGFTDAELSNVYDPRFVKLLADAAEFRKLKAAKPGINKRVAEGVKTIKPGAAQQIKQANQKAIEDAKARLQKTGKVEDAARLIAQRMR